MKLKVTPFRVLVPLGVVLVLLAATGVVLNRMPAPGPPGGYYLLVPDGAHQVAPLVHVASKHPLRDHGTLYFVDVQEMQQTRLDALLPWLHPHSTRIPARSLFPPGSTNQQNVGAELREMAGSKRIAAAVAERQLGLDVVMRPNGVLVNQIVLGTQGARKLQPTDLIISVNGKPTPTVASLRAITEGMTPGQIATLRIKRGEQTLVEKIKTINLHGRALIGFSPAQSATIKLPINVTIDTGDIGGPSAGLAFTLEVMQQLGADVTHGYKVAATGEMNLDGTVTAIGGVEQKTWGVRDAGAQVFLVPVDGGNAKLAEKFAGPDLRIIPVTSIGQALHALAALPKLK